MFVQWCYVQSGILPVTASWHILSHSGTLQKIEHSSLLLPCLLLAQGTITLQVQGKKTANVELFAQISHIWDRAWVGRRCEDWTHQAECFSLLQTCTPPLQLGWFVSSFLFALPLPGFSPLFLPHFPRNFCSPTLSLHSIKTWDAV